VFPTVSREALGQVKWQAGPAAVGVFLGEKWLFGVFPQHWWSFAGDDGRPAINQSEIQYFVIRVAGPLAGGHGPDHHDRLEGGQR